MGPSLLGPLLFSGVPTVLGLRRLFPFSVELMTQLRFRQSPLPHNELASFSFYFELP